MTRIAILLFVFGGSFVPDIVFSQQLVNTTGNTISANNLSIEYSIGEIAITTLASDDYATQGLLQPIVQFGPDPCKVAGLIPNAFTPNGDGLNDCYGIKGWGYSPSFEISIFNRWGQLVFHATDVNSCWDGKIRGKDQPTGVYVYLIKATTFCGQIFRKGTLALIR